MPDPLVEEVVASEPAGPQPSPERAVSWKPMRATLESSNDTIKETVAPGVYIWPSAAESPMSSFSVPESEFSGVPV